jgi:glucose-1-phosphatase
LKKSPHIKLYLFDLGGVIVDLNSDLCFKSFAKLFNLPVPEIQEIIASNGSFLKYELGLSSSRQFFHDILSEFKIKVEYNDLCKTLNTMILGIPNERIRLIEKLKNKRISVACLSNINAIHMDRIDEILMKSSSYSGLKDLMDLCFLSNEMGLKKPDIRAFHKVLEITGTIPEEILYFDDLEENVMTARSLGIQSHLVRDVPVDKLIMI